MRPSHISFWVVLTYGAYSDSFKTKWYEKSSDCLFWVGYIYDNDMGMDDKAKGKYELFLEKYPEHELSKDVTFLLGHLGWSDEEILEELLQKNKELQAAEESI